jgi:hypothetical protein
MADANENRSGAVKDRKVPIAAGRDCTAKGAGTISQVANTTEENARDNPLL